MMSLLCPVAVDGGLKEAASGLGATGTLSGTVAPSGPLWNPRAGGENETFLPITTVQPPGHGPRWFSELHAPSATPCGCTPTPPGARSPDRREDPEVGEQEEQEHRPADAGRQRPRAARRAGRGRHPQAPPVEHAEHQDHGADDARDSQDPYGQPPALDDERARPVVLREVRDHTEVHHESSSDAPAPAAIEISGSLTPAASPPPRRPRTRRAPARTGPTRMRGTRRPTPPPGCRPPRTSADARPGQPGTAGTAPRRPPAAAHPRTPGDPGSRRTGRARTPAPAAGPP